jgi:hypothetical protein
LFTKPAQLILASSGSATRLWTWLEPTSGSPELVCRQTSPAIGMERAGGTLRLAAWSRPGWLFCKIIALKGCTYKRKMILSKLPESLSGCDRHLARKMDEPEPQKTEQVNPIGSILGDCHLHGATGAATTKSATHIPSPSSVPPSRAAPSTNGATNKRMSDSHSFIR